MTTEEAEDAFFNHLETTWIESLYARGFEGSGRTFRRQLGEVIHVINVQGSQLGGSCCVNLGIHLLFLPTFDGSLVDPKTITEPLCVFRRRLAPAGSVDCWWEYGSDDEEAFRSSKELAKIYSQEGLPYFRRFSAFPEDFTRVTDAQTKLKGNALLPGRLTSETGYLLALARIYQHVGDLPRAKSFAAHGLANLGRAILLEAPFRAILDAE